MVNSWLRLWHDLPTDPKFRTIAKISKQSISSVIAVYIMMLVDASSATERGITQCDSEDFASALDLEIEQIEAIKNAMQGRLLDGDHLTGWERRQPKREDDSNERVKKHRKNILKNQTDEKYVTQCNAMKRSVTQCNARGEERREEEIREDQYLSSTDVDDSAQPKNLADAPAAQTKIEDEKNPPCPCEKILELYHKILPMGVQVKAFNERRKSVIRTRWKESKLHQSLEFWETFFQQVANSDFLTGKVWSQGKRPFVLTLDKILQSGIFVNNIEGAYLPRKDGKPVNNLFD